MSKLDWYYVHSPRYEFFHTTLCEIIDKAFFNPHPLFVDQSVFDEHLYKHDGEHFFSRITVKIDKIIEIIEERLSLQNTAPFMFTDCDILVTQYASRTLPFCTKYDEVDIIFQREYLTNTLVNPGCMMIRPKEVVLEFWKAVRDHIIQNNTMDMDSINTIISSGQNKVKYSFFSTRDVCSSHTISHSTFSLYHVLGNCISKDIDIALKISDLIRMTKQLSDLQAAAVDVRLNGALVEHADGNLGIRRL